MGASPSFARRRSTLECTTQRLERLPIQNSQDLIWIDLEMTGLDLDRGVIIETATIITSSDPNTLAEGPVIATHQPEGILAGMDEWSTRRHG